MSFSRFIVAATVGAVSLAAWARVDNPWTYHEGDDEIGRIYYYERTNIDGSMDERVTVFRRDASNIEVYKENGLCQRAALVTAQLDLETLSAPVITGGALQPEDCGFGPLVQEVAAGIEESDEPHGEEKRRHGEENEKGKSLLKTFGIEHFDSTFGFRVWASIGDEQG